MRLALPLALLLSGCTASQAFIVTGESLDLAGRQFALASDAMQAGQKSGAVTSEQFLKWAEFSARFTALYDRSVDALSAARSINDAAASKDLEAVVGRLVVELAGWYGLAKQLNLLPPGAP